MKIWKSLNIVWLILFIIAAIFIMLRKVDGSGVIQNQQIRMANLEVLGAFLVFVILCQLVVFMIIKSKQKNRTH